MLKPSLTGRFLSESTSGFFKDLGLYFLGPCKTTVIRILEIDGSKSTRPLCSLCTLVLDPSIELVNGTLLYPYKAQLTLVREALIVFITSQLFLSG